MIFISLSLWSFNVLAGVIITGTRMVITGEKGEASISLKNTSNKDVLIQAKISSDVLWKGQTNQMNYGVGFAVTPPLFVLKGKGENIIRVIKTHGILPEDRESLFSLDVNVIPSGRIEGNSLQIAFNNRIKVLWRPEGLDGGGVEKAYEKLKWRREPGVIVVNNPTPYIVTLFNLHVNDIQVENAGVIMPYSERKEPWCVGHMKCSISWQTIGDFGQIMPAVSATPVL